MAVHSRLYCPSRPRNRRRRHDPGGDAGQVRGGIQGRSDCRGKRGHSIRQDFMRRCPGRRLGQETTESVATAYVMIVHRQNRAWPSQHKSGDACFRGHFNPSRQLRRLAPHVANRAHGLRSFPSRRLFVPMYPPIAFGPGPRRSDNVRITSSSVDGFARY